MSTHLKIQLWLGYIFLSFALIGCILSLAHAIGLGIVAQPWLVFGAISDGSSSTAPIMIGLTSISGAALVINATRST
ncbi:MAG: hypothetical protein H7A43_06390 [Verrucomicrobia bacterium]|nr:hypothetical protein [Verrucomicrobiota bacterium]